MYKLCERCRFHVPTKNALCNVCGSQSFSEIETAHSNHVSLDQSIDQSMQTISSFAASSMTATANMSEQLGAMSARFSSVFADYGRDLVESGLKVKSAAIKMKNLIAMPALETAHTPSHDEVLSFHKNITFGRKSTVQKTVEVTQSSNITASKTTNNGATMDDSEVEMIGELQPFTPMLVKPLDAQELETALKADVETLKHNLDELKEWFENYGKEDTLLRNQTSQLKFSDRQERHAA